MKQLGAAVLVAAALAGCGSAQHGTASVWVTRDRGAHVLLVRKVPAGLTAMQALQRVAHVQTRYAGRFVQSINGVSGSLERQQDWFYFVNGYEADRGAAEYRLHPGDVEWWDYRSWKTAMRVPVVVGAFPEPFLHGYDGKRLTACVVGPRSKAKRMLQRLLHARSGPCEANVLILEPGARERFAASTRGAGERVRFVYVGNPLRLARNPQLARFRYSLP